MTLSRNQLSVHTNHKAKALDDKAEQERLGELFEKRLAGRRPIDTNISDLFFNTDVSDAAMHENGEFVGYDERKLEDEAKMFLASLARLNVAVPSAEDLILDYYARI